MPESQPNPYLQWFKYEHLPSNLKLVSQPFGELAKQLDSMLPNNPDKTAALRKLREAKDCAVTAALWENAPRGI